MLLLLSCWFVCKNRRFYSLDFYFGRETELPVLLRSLLAWVQGFSSFDRSGHKKYCTQPPMQHCKVVPDSGIKEIFACGIQIPGLRNQNSDLGIRNPTNNWNPKSKFHWQGPRSSMQSRIQLRLSWITLPRGPAPVLMTYSRVNRSPFDCVSNRNPKSQFKCVCFTIQLSLPNERDKDTKYFSMFLSIERMVYL